MKTVNEKYNELVYKIPQERNTAIEAENYNLDYDEFKRIVEAIERDGLFKEGMWCLSGHYHFRGLTFEGQNFIENNDKKEYSKIEKTEINYNHQINIGRDNHGIVVSGDKNKIYNSKFEKEFIELIDALKKSELTDKQHIINELTLVKDNKTNLQTKLGHLLTRGAEVGSITSMIVALLSSL